MYKISSKTWDQDGLEIPNVPEKRFMHIQIEIQNDLERFLAKSKYLYNILSYVGMSVRITFSQRLKITWSDRRTPETPDISWYASRS